MCPLMRWFTATVLMAVGFASSVEAQPDPMSWGDIPDEQFAMELYPADSSASAVILGSYGKVHFLENLTVIYDFHERVKIFSEAGYERATIEFAYYAENNTQRVRRLEGQTYIRDANGNVRRVALERRDIMEEEDGNITRVRFTLPVLEPGAIIEYRWRMESRDPVFFPDWYFQDSDPTLHSEFRVEIPTWLTFNRYPVGDPVFTVEDISERQLALTDFPHRASTARVNTRTANTYRWVVNDVPDIRDEEFIAAFRNHAYAMRFQLTGYYERGGVHRSLSQNWLDVARYLLGHQYFGSRITSPPQTFRREALRIVDGAEDLNEAVSRIYDFVRQRMTWNGRYTFYSSRPLTQAFNARQGNSGEINLLLTAMLRSINIDANPVLISTRRNGHIISSLPSENQFNHVITSVVIDDALVLMDATDQHRPLNMLPVQALNHHGWLLGNDHFEWIAIEPARGTSSALQLTAEIDARGNVSGSLAGRFGGYLGLDLRQRLRPITEETRRGTAIVRDDNIETSGITVNGLDGDGAITFELNLIRDEHARPMGHLLLFNPILMGRMEENPFQAPRRTYPVDFTYPRVNTYVATFTIPEGYEVDELPEAVEISMPDHSITYQRTVTLVNDRQISVQRSYALRYTLFDPSDYPTLRNVFEEIVAADREVVVLVRSDASDRELPVEAEELLSEDDAETAPIEEEPR